MDTGATDHIVNSVARYKTYRPVHDVYVKLPNEETVPVSYIGDICLTSDLTLHNVLCVPKFAFNLISASKLMKTSNCFLIFFPIACYIQDIQSWKTIGLAKEKGGLYLFQDTEYSADSSSVIHQANTITFEALWHFRLGHPSSSRVQVLKQDHPFISNDKVDCEICHFSKQRKLSFPVSLSISKNYFDLVHIDIWGPMSVISVYGHRYFLTVIDNKSRYTWVFPMKNKSEARTLIENFCIFVETQFSTKIKCIRSDNGREFDMPSFNNSKGIVHQTSCVYTPQQNGTVKRKHQHILNVARALKFQSNIPIVFWTDCILHATYLINRIPSPIINNKTPYQILFNTAPLLDHLKIFGCQCFVSPPKSHLHKFDSRALECVFLNYALYTKDF